MGRTDGTRRAAAMAMVAGLAATVGILGLGGCLQILGDDGTFIGKGGTGGTPATGGTGGTTSGGTGGGGTGGVESCTPSDVEACYTGLDGTQNIGICKAGTRTCGANGTWGACEGEIVPAAETCETTTDEDCDNRECALWSLISQNDAPVFAMGAATDSGGNLIVFGAFQGTLSFGGDTLDAANGGPWFIAKLSPSGAVLWNKNIIGGGGGGMTEHGLAVDGDDNIYFGVNFAGSFTVDGISYSGDGQDFSITKLTPDGALVWSNHYGGPADQDLWAIAVDTNGFLRAIGEFTDSVAIGGDSASGNGVFAAKISTSDGVAESAMLLTGGVWAPKLATAADNAWVLAGDCSDGAVVGGKTLNPCGGLAAKFDASDALQWAVSIPYYEAFDVAFDMEGNVLVASAFLDTIDYGGATLSSNGSWDVLVAKLNSADGTVEWAKSCGGTGDDRYVQLAIDEQNRYFLGLSQSAPVDFGGGPVGGAGQADLLVGAFDSAGNYRYSRGFGDAGYQAGRIVSRRDGGGPYLVAWNYGDINFGAGPLHSEIASIAIAELAP